MSLFFAALMLQATAPATEWVQTGRDGNGLTASYDPASVTRLDGTRRRVRLRLVSDRPFPSGLVTAIITVELGCSDNAITVIRNEGYDGTGRQLVAADVPPAQRRTGRVPPGGAEAVMAERVCAAPTR